MKLKIICLAMLGAAIAAPAIAGPVGSASASPKPWPARRTTSAPCASPPRPGRAPPSLKPT